MELQGPKIPVLDGYQQSPINESLIDQAKNTASTSFSNMQGTTSTFGEYERRRLLQMNNQPSYSTTNNDTSKAWVPEDGMDMNFRQESIETNDSSYTAILSLDSDEGSIQSNSRRSAPSEGRKDSLPFTTVSTAPPTVQIWGYRKDSCLTVVTALLCLLTGGLLALLLYWRPKWRATMTAMPCKLADATVILIRDDHQQWALEKVQLLHRPDGITLLDTFGVPVTTPTLRVFDHRKVRFIWHPKRRQFQILSDLDQRCPLSVYYQREELGLTQQMVLGRLACYGPNKMDVELTPLVQLFFREALQPLSIFQIFSVILWFTGGYVLFGVVIILMTSISWAVNVYSVRKSQRDLRRMAGVGGNITVLRDGVVQNLSSTKLVPGDVVNIDSEADCGQIINYDAILISGGCVMNESALTGESVPITKPSVFYTEGEPKEVFDYHIHGKHVIYAGTKLLQVRSSFSHPAKAVVIRTGFHTAKGRLVRSILFPKPIDYRFTKDLLTLLFTLGILGICGMIWATITLRRFHSSTYTLVLRVLGVITIVVPPLLPAAMSVGVVLAQNRLRRKQIFCISPSTINACGSIDAVCFDKTGTLTEDGLELTHIRITNSGRFDDERSAHEISGLSISGVGNEKHAARVMSTCHTLVLLDNNGPGGVCRLVGDPIDIALFDKTGWHLKRPGGLTMVQYPGCVAVVEGPAPSPRDQDRDKFLVLHQFIFTANLKRISVIVHDQVTGSYFAYCKGAPETIRSLCNPDTVPTDFDSVLTEYTREGCRVIGLAFKKLSPKNGSDHEDFNLKQWSRDRVESEMVFVGLAILENRLKPATKPIIYELCSANIRSIMITGDHIDTAVHVARQCGMLAVDKKLYLVEFDRHGKYPVLKNIPPPMNMETKELMRPLERTDLERTDLEMAGVWSYQLAITGPAFTQICNECPELTSRLVAACTVFARMAPEQKTQVVNVLQSIDYTVAACGDGANDCGALKAAHAGISLSEAEASVASPFTSQITDISCVPTLISEGRAALVTSFGLAKYMVAYSFIQFFTTCLVYSINSDLPNNQYVMVDLFLVTLLSVVFGRTPAEERLSVQQPPGRLVAPPIVLGMVIHAAVTILFQGMSFGVIQHQPWFNGTVIRGSGFGNTASMQGTAVFMMSTFQYIWMAFVFSKGRPYRKPFYYNWMMVLIALVQVSVCVWFTVDPGYAVAKFMRFIPATEPFYRICSVIMAFVNLGVYLVVEMFIVEWLLLKKLQGKEHSGLVIAWFSGRPKQLPMYERIARLIGDSPNWLTNAQTKI